MFPDNPNAEQLTEYSPSTAQYPILKRTISYRKNLEMQAQEMEKRAKDIRDVLAIFEKNPELENLLDAMRRLGV